MENVKVYLIRTVKNQHRKYNENTSFSNTTSTIRRYPTATSSFVLLYWCFLTVCMVFARCLIRTPRKCFFTVKGFPSPPLSNVYINFTKGANPNGSPCGLFPQRLTKAWTPTVDQRGAGVLGGGGWWTCR